MLVVKTLGQKFCLWAWISPTLGLHWQVPLSYGHGPVLNYHSWNISPRYVYNFTIPSTEWAVNSCLVHFARLKQYDHALKM